MVEYFQNLPPWLATIIIATLPVIELRGAIPVAVGVYHLTILEAFIFSVIGNMIPAVFLVYFLESITKYLMKVNVRLKNFFDWLFDRTRRKFSEKHKKYGAIALLIFVAIPLPATGVWTAAVAAYLFGIKQKTSILCMFGGVVIAGLIVSIFSFGLFNLF